MKRTVLVTGAGGFLAGHAVKQFRAAGWRTIGIGRSDAGQQAGEFDAFLLNDLADVPRILSVLERYAPDAIVHLAAPSSVPQSLREPLADFAGHVLPAGKLLEAVRRSGLASRFLLISSAAVYGNPATSPISEATPPAPISPYGFHKLQQELLVDEYVTLHGLRCCKARLFSTYGENLRRLAVWEIARRALAGDLRVHGTGDETRDYLYADDVGRAMVCIAENADFRGETINVASGEAVSIRMLAAKIFELLGIREAPQFLQDPLPGSPIHWAADVTRLQRLGFTAPSWSVALPRVLEWIRHDLA
jgi:UDP-glucose 4-epimerase